MEEVNLKPSRLAKRASYDSEQIYSILDEGLVCQVAYVENSKPMMIPTGYCRIEDKLYIHGSVGSHFMRSLADGREVCISVSLLDGLVLARSAFHHSVNYRSVVIFGQAELITDEQEAWDALEAFTEHVIKGRWAEVREPDASEMKKTMVLAFSLEKASAKVRVGNPSDDEEDYELPVWAGVLPLKQVAQAPITDPLMRHQTPIPDYVANYSREK
ncbi:pyridoxamine 5'-phosphate oxidase family protein [Flectobacillus sp. DC10W]|uniref:Pyridoxamine 5'-phosphate oxidase family protein n=1 Tax=Flectobacillus longus TaxID=2984207 RepID=A0ABT6YSQ6_9BACT|nr:pyridoxamine 5'-phosphate oxidase family protein [Flectobacillus longus]MDI9866596.1 pyridoxamine 5'-phosphate oxidase family protein [Flectobacillus longus]